ncbi:cellulose-binding protein [Haloechinothrix salitolerans]|uniref:Cellulose-binding protein n=1 Tax=Haloechinothrix salitolerans TaxID=926830 RepID=A0ABW2C1E5_9PSEU
MESLDIRDDLVPLRTDFDVSWRGYDRGQVRRYVHGVEAELRLVTADRDAAVAEAENLATQLEASRSEVRELRARLDQVCRTPIDPEAVPGRLRRMVELARDEAAEITGRAQMAAEHTWNAAQDAAQRLRKRSEWLLADLDAQRTAMAAEYRELTERARTEAETMSREAERRRIELDEAAEQHRKHVTRDFEIAMLARRVEARREIAEQRRAAQTEAEGIVAEARAEAARIVRAARREADALRQVRDDLADRVRALGRLFADAAPLLRPDDEPVPEQRVATPA